MTDYYKGYTQLEQESIRKAKQCILRFWKTHAIKSSFLVKQCLNVKLSENRLQEMNIYTLRHHLSLRIVVEAAGPCVYRFLEKAKQIIGCNEDTEIPDFKNIRIFLSSFLILYHPQQAFGGVENEESSKLYNASRKMISDFFACCNMIIEPANYGPTCYADNFKQFFSSCTIFRTLYGTWKRQDEERIVNNIRGKLVHLHGLWRNLDDSRYCLTIYSEVEQHKKKETQIIDDINLLCKQLKTVSFSCCLFLLCFCVFVVFSLYL